ncbi:MAG: hypothetical protein WCR68_02150 [Candidatus Dojkabacteria bacterium]|jgi:hypothetical protein
MKTSDNNQLDIFKEIANNQYEVKLSFEIIYDKVLVMLSRTNYSPNNDQMNEVYNLCKSKTSLFTFSGSLITYIYDKTKRPDKPVEEQEMELLNEISIIFNFISSYLTIKKTKLYVIADMSKLVNMLIMYYFDLTKGVY